MSMSHRSWFSEVRSFAENARRKGTITYAVVVDAREPSLGLQLDGVAFWCPRLDLGARAGPDR